MATLATADEYQYCSLNSSNFEVRLLKIHAGSSRQIECNIAIFELESAPEYVALSYTWGPPVPTFEILVNRGSFTIRKNLYRFLLEYRKTEEQYIWIDQICIDQSNTEERNLQVALMSTIYTSCSSVIMWLCGSKQTSMAAYYWTHEHHFGTLINLLRNQYFTRLWIVQEVLLAPNIRVLVQGGHWMLWSDMRRMMRDSIMMTKKPDLPESIVSLFDQPRESRPGQYELGHCLNKYSGNNCTDPRDRVFGLMSLVAEGQRVEVDYNKSLQEVYADTMKALLGRMPFYVSRGANADAVARNDRKLLKTLGGQLGVTLTTGTGLGKFIQATKEEHRQVQHGPGT